MWTQNYTPLAGSLALSALAAALPAFAMLYLLGVRRLPAWKASVAGLGSAVVVALVEEFNAQCPKCAYLMNVGEGMRNEQIRCRHCGMIMSAKTAWARRAFVLSRQKGQR